MNLTTTLRPEYQLPIYNEIPVRLAKEKSVIVQSPARSGKSVIISHTVARIIKAGRIPLILTHRSKIQTQLIKHCDGVSIDADVEHIFITTGKCFVAMKQTLAKRPSILKQLTKLGSKLVVISDECHSGIFCKLLDLLPDAYRIGFTATPAWKWAKWLPDYYKSLIHGPQVLDLTSQGNITPIEYYEMRSDLDTLRKGSNGEYTEESQFSTFDRAKLYDGLFTELDKFTFNKCIIFTASKKAADALGLQFKNHAPHYSVTTFYSGKDRLDLAKFTELDQANVLITVSALSEGFDHPPIDMNVLWRATSSLPMFIQMGMRGATPHPGKLKTTVLDFGGNNSRFGGQRGLVALTMDRDWNALWQPPPIPPRTSDGVAQIKNCPQCDFIISAMSKSCCNCGYIYPDAEVQLKVGELVKIENDLAVVAAINNRLNGQRISSLTPEQLAIYATQRNKKPFAARVAKAKEQQEPGWLGKYAAAIGYKPGWVKWQLENMDSAHIEFHDILIR